MTVSNSRPSPRSSPSFIRARSRSNGMSKAYCMTGWRLGYAAGATELIKAMAALQSQSTTNPSSISQAAGVEALNGPQDFIASNNAIFKERRDLVVKMLNESAGSIARCRRARSTSIRPAPARSASARRKARPSRATPSSANTCWNSVGVAVVPGTAFGLAPYFRISYAAATPISRRGLPPHPEGLRRAEITD